MKKLLLPLLCLLSLFSGAQKFNLDNLDTILQRQITIKRGECIGLPKNCYVNFAESLDLYTYCQHMMELTGSCTVPGWLQQPFGHVACFGKNDKRVDFDESWDKLIEVRKLAAVGDDFVVFYDEFVYKQPVHAFHLQFWPDTIYKVKIIDSTTVTKGDTTTTIVHLKYIDEKAEEGKWFISEDTTYELIVIKGAPFTEIISPTRLYKNKTKWSR